MDRRQINRSFHQFKQNVDILTASSPIQQGRLAYHADHPRSTQFGDERGKRTANLLWKTFHHKWRTTANSIAAVISIKLKSQKDKKRVKQ